MAVTMRDVMSPAPVSLAADESALTTAQAMKEHGIGTVLVVTGGKLSGLVTDRDIVIRVLAEDRDPGTTPVGAIASRDLAVLGPDDDVDQAIRLLRERAVRRIPIVRDGAPVGMVSVGDLALNQDRGSALSDVSAAAPNI
jgi:CBS domain-containing protein